MEKDSDSFFVRLWNKRDMNSFFFRLWDKRDKWNAFIIGAVGKVVCLVFIFLVLGATTDLVDMNEKVAKAIEYLLSGTNPYGQWYMLHAGF